MNTPNMVYIVIVNWNGLADTIECLESVFRLEYDRFVVIICDNASADGSVEAIERWAQTSRAFPIDYKQLPWKRETELSRPIRYARIRGWVAETFRRTDERLLILETGANLGFAGGTNVGIRFGLSCSDMEFVWVLNNDTVVAPDALSALVQRMHANPEAGLCGSRLQYYDAPHFVQALGGSSWNRWTARGYHIGSGPIDKVPIDPGVVESRMAYVVGASMLASRAFLDKIGLMDERYFLYGEEIDWTLRGKGLFSLAFAQDSIVLHKEGRSIGTARQTQMQSLKPEYYGVRSRVMVTKKFYPALLPVVLVAVAASFVHRCFKGRLKNARMIVLGVRDALLGITGAAPHDIFKGD